MNLENIKLLKIVDIEIKGKPINQQQTIELLTYLENIDNPEVLEYLNFKWIWIDGTISYNKAPRILPDTHQAVVAFIEAFNLLAKQFEFLEIKCLIYNDYLRDEGIINLIDPQPVILIRIETGELEYSLPKKCIKCEHRKTYGQNLIKMFETDEEIQNFLCGSCKNKNTNELIIDLNGIKLTNQTNQTNQNPNTQSNDSDDSIVTNTTNDYFASYELIKRDLKPNQINSEQIRRDLDICHETMKGVKRRIKNFRKKMIEDKLNNL